jgi:hypothetical protein
MMPMSVSVASLRPSWCCAFRARTGICKSRHIVECPMRHRASVHVLSWEPRWVLETRKKPVIKDRERKSKTHARAMKGNAKRQCVIDHRIECDLSYRLRTIQLALWSWNTKRWSREKKKKWRPPLFWSFLFRSSLIFHNQDLTFYLHSLCLWHDRRSNNRAVITTMNFATIRKNTRCPHVWLIINSFTLDGYRNEDMKDSPDSDFGKVGMYVLMMICSFSPFVLCCLLPEWWMLSLLQYYLLFLG